MSVTPGPWHMHGYYCAGMHYTVRGPDGKDLARFDQAAGGWSLSKDDAQAIASVPAMIEALERINDWCRLTADGGMEAKLLALQQIRVAATKALEGVPK